MVAPTRLLTTLLVPITAIANPVAAPHESEYSLAERYPDVSARHSAADVNSWERSLAAIRDTKLQEKRKGGGGRGSSGGSSGGSSSSSSGSRGGSGSSGSTGSTGSRGGGASYGGGTRFAGGSSSSYRPGAISSGGIRPTLLGAGAGLGFAGAFYLWPRPVYAYPWGVPYGIHGRNRTNTTGNAGTHVVARQDATQMANVTCLCDQSAPGCGCDNPNNATFLDSLFGPGFNNSLQPDVATIQVVNGSDAVVINGTLDQDDSDDGDSSESSTSAAVPRLQQAGSGVWLVMVGAVVVGCWFP